MGWEEGREYDKRKQTTVRKKCCNQETEDWPAFEYHSSYILVLGLHPLSTAILAAFLNWALMEVIHSPAIFRKVND